jgi:translation initiation factor IF-3
MPEPWPLESIPPGTAKCEPITKPQRERPLHVRAGKESFPIQVQNRVNGRIRAREVRVIMASTGEQLGVMKLSDAIRRAQELGLDLVEVAANANPPVCRIVDFGKFKYEASKQEKDKKNTGSRLKEIKFRVNCAEHDYETKMRHAEEFLDKGNKVRVHLQFRGREMAHQELGMALMSRVKSDLATMAQVEMEPKLMGKSVTMTLAALPPAKRKRRFASDHDLPPLEESDEPEEEDEE